MTVRVRVAMSLVRLLGFTTLSCGCVVGRYRELATSREITLRRGERQNAAAATAIDATTPSLRDRVRRRLRAGAFTKAS